jgi:hypothetical protein
MFDTLREKLMLTRAETSTETDIDSAEADTTATGSETPDQQTHFGYKPPRSPKSVSDDADAEVTSVSASTAHLLSHGSRMGTKFTKTIYATWIPPNPRPGTLDPLINHSSAGVTTKVVAHPLPREDALSVLETRFEVTVRRLDSDGGGRSDSIESDLLGWQKEQIRSLYTAVKNGTERMFLVGVYATVRADTKDDVDTAVQAITNAMKGEDISMNVTGWQPCQSLRTTAPLGELSLPSSTLIPMSSTALGRLRPLSGSDLIEPSGVLFGYHCMSRSPVVVDRWERDEGHNMLVIGGIRNGKTVFKSLVLLRRLTKDRDVRSVIIDPRGGFKDLVNTIGGETYRIGGRSVTINPLELQPTPKHILNEKPSMDPLRSKIRNVMASMSTFYAQNGELAGTESGTGAGSGSRAGSGPRSASKGGGGSGLSSEEYATLNAAVPFTYKEAGIKRRPDTHTAESPIIDDLDETLYYIENSAKEFLREIDYPHTDRAVDKFKESATTLRMGLQPFRGNGQYSHLNGQTSVDLDNRLTLLSLEQSEESETLPFEMTLLFDLLYEYNKRPGRTINAIDEAHQLLQNPASLNWLERSLRYSGHFDASFAMLTQSSEDFLINPAARTIASNCSIKVYFRDKGMTTDHGDYLGLSPREVRFVNQATPGDRARGYSQCLLDVDGHGTRPLRVEGLPSELEIIDPLDDDEREALPDDQLSSWRASV